VPVLVILTVVFLFAAAQVFSNREYVLEQ